MVKVDEITEEFLLDRGFNPREDEPSCWVQDFGDGYRLQLVAHMDGFGVEVWNSVEDVRGRAAFAALITRREQVSWLLELMGEVPF